MLQTIIRLKIFNIINLEQNLVKTYQYLGLNITNKLLLLIYFCCKKLTVEITRSHLQQRWVLQPTVTFYFTLSSVHGQT